MDPVLAFALPAPPTRIPVRPGWWLAFAAGIAGLAVCITALYFGMREVMDVGGACAEGGPYEVAVPCPDGVEVMIIPSFPLLFAFGGLVAVAGSKVAAGAGSLVGLAWCGLFLALGWNFLEYGLDPAGPASGADWGLLSCAVMFALMGGLPLGLVPGMVRGLERRPWVLGVALVAIACGVLAGRALAVAVTA